MATIVINSKQEYPGNIFRVSVRITDVNFDQVTLLKFKDNPTDLQVNNTAQDWFSHHQYDFETFNPISIIDNEEVIIRFITKIKGTPTITLSQYNTWLSQQMWYEASIIRTFVYKLAISLSNFRSISLNDYTESSILQALRNYIVSCPVEKLYKIILNH